MSDVPEQANNLRDRYIDLWLRELCVLEPKEGPATLRRWYLALTTGAEGGAANENGAEAVDMAAAKRLSTLCRTCAHPCSLPLP